MSNLVRTKFQTLATQDRVLPRFVFFFVVFNIYLTFRVPEVYDNFWAEDGGYFYTKILNEPSFDFMFEFSSGYYLLIDRIIALPLYFVYPPWAPLVNAVMVISFQSFLASRILTTMYCIFRVKSLAFAFPVFVFILPISNFESIGAATGLHFQLNFMCVFILYKILMRQAPDTTDFFILIISLLSGPLTLLVLPLMLIKSKLFLKVIREHMFASGFVLCAFFIQIWAIYSQALGGTRGFGSERSISKALYLFLERVFAINFIPGWNHIDSSMLETSGTILLWMRLFIISLAGILVFFFLFIFRGSIFRNLEFSAVAFLSLGTLALWFIPAYLFNGEPRYAVAPAATFALLLFSIFESLARSLVQSRASQMLLLFAFYLSSLIALNGIPTQFRVQGESFSKQIEYRVSECANEAESIEVFARPRQIPFVVRIPCTRLVQND